MQPRLVVILADQLSNDIASLRAADPQRDLVVLAEVDDEARYVPHHPQKIALLFSAMRHFAEQLEQQGWRVHYHQYQPQGPARSLLDVLHALHAQHDFAQVLITQCGEYRLQHLIEQHWPAALGIEVQCLQDDRFVTTPEQFAQWAKGRKQLRMEYFYRNVRRQTGLLMEDDEPVSGQWNLDANNRKAYKGEVPIPPQLQFERDDIDREVLALVEQHFADHAGELTAFHWATTRDDALQALQHFIEHRLPWFGDYQDAMVRGESFMFHSLISPYLNCGLLQPMEVCLAAERAWQQGKAPLNAVEGFIRQIIGWREYVRGIYWLTMPDYARLNRLENTRPLPAFYWHGDTKMQCMKQCFASTFQYAYAHHIQRLMVTGNFALLAGIEPQQICDWYLAVYADAYDWVELPNTLGMVMHADGGYLGSKPYAASGNYINKMSDYCSHCHYSVKTATDEGSCPFNSLYWHFMQRHRQQFSRNPRMTMVYRSFDRMQPQKQDNIIARAEHLLDNIEAL
ncbi:cryptochrome/photolyase family protein [Bacterioplanes sanyensis]|uniref:Cryptochrome/photolyase family protein n=1 Tax=Bacterioplanes sanyensis TaxID=1249553 RepID=A0A222FDZ8_9GAMM|nr:cryptochrome/photolyase family protein [Bacterioplanes sanyensis]ASP37317.1 cryptochrome/photolyase family protein [Bacterioplanes sanyensis]